MSHEFPGGRSKCLPLCALDGSAARFYDFGVIPAKAGIHAALHTGAAW